MAKSAKKDADIVKEELLAAMAPPSPAPTDLDAKRYCNSTLGKGIDPDTYQLLMDSMAPPTKPPNRGVISKK